MLWAMLFTVDFQVFTSHAESSTGAGRRSVNAATRDLVHRCLAPASMIRPVPSSLPVSSSRE